MPKTANVQLVRTPHTRLWLTEDGASPVHVPEYLGVARAQGYSWPQGDVTPVRVPSEDAYDSFDVADEIRGQRGLPSFSTQHRMERQLSEMLRIIRKDCPVDLQLHVGDCGEPTDFNGGWQFVRILENARATSYDTDDMGAFDSDANAPITETIPWTGDDLYDVKQLIPSEVESAEVTDEVIAVTICDKRTCGACGLPSDGCQVVLAVQKAQTGSPGLPIEVVFTSDGGNSWDKTNVSAAAVSAQASGAECVGQKFVIISENGESLYYADTADIINAEESWSAVTAGFVATKGPKAISSVSSTKTWIAAEGGYAYFTSDIEAGVEVQSAGGQTTQDLLDVHALDSRNVVMVGNSNAIIYSTNGGQTWAAITGPNVGVNLNAVWMQSSSRWLVGDAAGKLWYTQNAGGTWTQIRFPGDTGGSVRDIKFSTRSVGYLAHDTAASAGRILRTIDGGRSWYVLPEQDGITFPGNDRITAIAACGDDPNVVFGGGLATNGTDGILVVAA